MKSLLALTTIATALAATADPVDVRWCAGGENTHWSNLANWHIKDSNPRVNPSELDFSWASVDNGYGLSGDVEVTLDGSYSLSQYYCVYYTGGTATLKADSTTKVLTSSGYMAFGGNTYQIFDTVGVVASGINLPSGGSTPATLVVTNATMVLSGNADIAKNGHGTLVIAGNSSVAINGTMYVGNNTSNMSTGTVTVAKGSTFTLTNDAKFGHNTTGILNVDGGYCNLSSLTLGNANETYSDGILNLNSGMVAIKCFYHSKGKGTINLNGGVLAAKEGNNAFIPSSISVNIGGNCVISNDYDITIAADIAVGDHLLVKKGTGKLTLSGTVTGEILVENGTVATTGDATGATITPKPTASINFNNGAFSNAGSINSTGVDGNYKFDGWTEGEANFVGSADGADGALLIDEKAVPHLKGNYGMSSYNNDDVWSVAMSVRSVETENAVIVGFGYNNDSTKNDWGILSAGKDKMKFAYWQKDASALEGAVEFDVPDSTTRFHEIVIVHPKGTTYLTDEGTISLKIYVDGTLATQGHYYTKWFKLADGTQTGGNDIRLGGFDGAVHQTSSSKGVLKRGDGVAFNDFRTYYAALTEKQVQYLSATSLPTWPEMITVTNGETYTVSAAETWTDKLLKLEAGATLSMPTTGGITFAKSLYDLNQLLFLPDSGTVTIALSDAAGQMVNTSYTLLDDIAARTSADLAKLTLDRSGVAEKFSVKMRLDNGNIIDRINKKGFMIVVQ